MQGIKKLLVAHGETIVFKPARLHGMLRSPTHGISRAGDLVSCELLLLSNEKISLVAAVVEKNGTSSKQNQTGHHGQPMPTP